MRMGKSRGNKGQSLLELIVALGIFVVGVATLGFLQIDSNVASRQGFERTRAALLAKEGLEAARSIRDASFNNLVSGPHGIALSGNTWIFSGISDTQDQFTRQVNISDIDIDTKKIKSIVTWPITEARQGSITLTDYLTDWNQTHGDAKKLALTISGAVLAGGDKRLEGITIENSSGVPGDNIIISRITLWWNSPDTMHRIRIDGSDVFKVIPPDGEPSGTEIDITDFTLLQGSGIHDIEFWFNGSVAGTDFIIKFIMSDGSTKYVLIDL